VIPGKTADDLLKVRHGIVEEVGIADARLASTRAQAVVAF